MASHLQTIRGMNASKKSSAHPKRAHNVHANVTKIVHNRKVVAQVGGPKAVLAALQTIVDAFVPESAELGTK